MTTGTVNIEQLAINTIRTLSMDAVQAANSGHPGTPMALAPVAYALWNRVLKYDPSAPRWANRDRFVLSCGHASMLTYSMLHLCGVQETDESGNATGEPSVSLDEIRNFRQWGSKTPGHPEAHLTSGVETTTGPLGQGCGNSVGMAAASRWLAARFNRPGFELFDFDVFALCSDGDLMEGLSGEAASMAGHLKLGKLIYLYDSNKISIDGSTDLTFTEDTAAKYTAMGWHTTTINGHDHDAIEAALNE
ncbi:MAG: transketolase, partial [Planctomycetales bacterium]